MQDLTRMGRKYDPLEFVQEIKIWPYNKMVSAKPESILDIEMQKILWNLETQTDHQIPARRTDQV